MTVNTRRPTTSAFLGISIGKSYYSREHIRNYLSWAEVNFEAFAFLIGDLIYKYTLIAFKGLSFDDATDRALRMGDETARMLTELTAHARMPVTTMRWGDVVSIQEYSVLLGAVDGACKSNPSFQEAVRNQVWLNLGSRLEKIGVPKNPRVHNEISILFDSYIKEEVAGLIAVSEYTRYHTEIYPGQDLKILNDIYADMYPEVSSVLPKERKREFIPITIE